MGEESLERARKRMLKTGFAVGLFLSQLHLVSYYKYIITGLSLLNTEARNVKAFIIAFPINGSRRKMLAFTNLILKMILFQQALKMNATEVK